jgi:hypothetical protein
LFFKDFEEKQKAEYIKFKIDLMTTPKGYSLLYKFNIQFNLSAFATIYSSAPNQKVKYYSTIQEYPLVTNFTSPAEFQGPDSWDVILNSDIMNGISKCEDSYNCKISVLDEIDL